MTEQEYINEIQIQINILNKLVADCEKHTDLILFLLGSTQDANKVSASFKKELQPNVQP